MNKYLLNIDIATFINESNGQFTKNTIRRQQIINGLNKLFKYDFASHNCDVMITDNTCNTLPDDILISLPSTTIIRTFNDNRYGSINKGAGLIQKLLYNQDIISKYEYIIHFEARLLLKSHSFLDSFFENPATYFRYGDPNDKLNHTNFFTGLFTCESTDIINFCNEYSPEKLISQYISIEYIIKEFFQNKTILIDNLDLIWFETLGGIYHF